MKSATNLLEKLLINSEEHKQDINSIKQKLNTSQNVVHCPLELPLLSLENFQAADRKLNEEEIKSKMVIKC